MATIVPSIKGKYDNGQQRISHEPLFFLKSHVPEIPFDDIESHGQALAARESEKASVYFNLCDGR